MFKEVGLGEEDRLQLLSIGCDQRESGRILQKKFVGGWKAILSVVLRESSSSLRAE